MTLVRPTRPAALAATAGLAWLLASNPVSAQKADTRPDSRKSATASPAKAADKDERASGVILKVEKVTKGATEGSTIAREAEAGRMKPGTYRLTINTNAVWRDWARDQAMVKDNGPARKDAAKGAESVATKGEPADKNSIVVVDLIPETKVDTRFRASDDESSRGAKTPEAAAGEPAGKKNASSAAKPVMFKAEDLKPGLFVEVDFRHVPVQNPASMVTVIRPIGGPDGAAPPERAK